MAEEDPTSSEEGDEAAAARGAPIEGAFDVDIVQPLLAHHVSASCLLFGDASYVPARFWL